MGERGARPLLLYTVEIKEKRKVRADSCPLSVRNGDNVGARVYDDVITSRSSLGLLALDGFPSPGCVGAWGNRATRPVPRDSEFWQGYAPLRYGGGRRRGRLRRDGPPLERSRAR